MSQYAATDPGVCLVSNVGPHGFGYAVRYGLDSFTGDAVAIMMADGSDSPDDLVRYHQVLAGGAEVRAPHGRLVVRVRTEHAAGVGVQPRRARLAGSRGTGRAEVERGGAEPHPRPASRHVVTVDNRSRTPVLIVQST